MKTHVLFNNEIYEVVAASGVMLKLKNGEGFFVDVIMEDVIYMTQDDIRTGDEVWWDGNWYNYSWEMDIGVKLTSLPKDDYARLTNLTANSHYYASKQDIWKKVEKRKMAEKTFINVYFHDWDDNVVFENIDTARAGLEKYAFRLKEKDGGWDVIDVRSGDNVGDAYEKEFNYMGFIFNDY